MKTIESHWLVRFVIIPLVCLFELGVLGNCIRLWGVVGFFVGLVLVSAISGILIGIVFLIAKIRGEKIAWGRKHENLAPKS